MTPISRALVFGFLFTFLLFGCASKPPIIQFETITVRVPVSQPCAQDVGPAPTWPDTRETILAAANVGERIKLLLQGISEREQRLNDVEAAYAGCDVIASP